MGKFFYYEDIKNVNFDLILEIFVIDIYIYMYILFFNWEVSKKTGRKF